MSIGMKNKKKYFDTTSEKQRHMNEISVYTIYFHTVHIYNLQS